LDLSNIKGQIWLDGQWMEWSEAKVHVLTHTLHYGVGVFEGVRAYSSDKGASIFRLMDHTERLFSSAKIVNLPMNFSKDQFNKVQIEVLKKNDLKEAYIRPMCFYGAEGLGLRADNLRVHSLVAAWEWPSYMSPEASEKGIRVKISNYKRQVRNPVASAKVNGNYVTSIVALNEVLAEGYDETLMLDYEGYIAEGSGENFFIVKDGVLHTPDLDSCLDGITRKSIIEIADGLGFKTIVRKILPNEIENIQEAFFTGTAAEVVPIKSIDNIKVGSGKRGPITKILQQTYHKQVRGLRSEFQEWHTYI
jgi:branched-chain amino acid aminotransferase